MRGPQVDLDDDTSGSCRLLIRPTLRTGELAFYRTWSPTPAPLATLVTAAGRRWRIEQNIQSGKELAGLDEHQVRTWISWHRWTILGMLAHAFLAAMAAAGAPGASDQLNPLTCNEIRHLFTGLVARMHNDLNHLLRRSCWRRRHQTQARASHYRRRAPAPP